MIVSDRILASSQDTIDPTKMIPPLFISFKDLVLSWKIIFVFLTLMNPTAAIIGLPKMSTFKRTEKDKESLCRSVKNHKGK